MRQGKKPTAEQRKLIEDKGYFPREWLVVKDTPFEMTLKRRSGPIETVVLRK